MQVGAGQSRERGAAMVELVVPPGSPAAGRRLVDLHFPPGVLVVLVKKPDGVVVPGGGTVLDPGDGVVVVLAEREMLDDVRAIVDGRTAAAGEP